MYSLKTESTRPDDPRIGSIRWDDEQHIAVDALIQAEETTEDIPQIGVGLSYLLNYDIDEHMPETMLAVSANQ
ncbi:hypothetical protein VZT92_014588 [Zoarces viviparus]|uniref:Uncharacterized protein n=1 Tax=Zoarces viviparus TaxID=48416 RepID=A0AAW1F089_ZOAVI